MSLPILYKFPEDIATILGGHVKVNTIRSWKTKGLLRTRKVGAKTFVEQSAWTYFLENNNAMMKGSDDNRGARLAHRRKS